MIPTHSGLYPVDPTHAVHHAAADFLWDLILDLDFVRIGKPPMNPVTGARLDRWAALADGVRGCCRLAPGGHAEELAFGEALVVTVQANIAAGLPLRMPDCVVSHYLDARARLERCRETTKKY